MPSKTQSSMPVKRRSRPIVHTFRRYMPVWLLLPVLVAILVTAATFASAADAPRPPERIAHMAEVQPAHLFIRSIVKDEGSSSLQQLYRSVHVQMPRYAVIQQARAPRASRTLRTKQGIALAAGFVRAQPSADGGQLRVDVAKVDRPLAILSPKKRIDPVAIWIAGLGGVALVLLAIIGLVVGVLIPKKRGKPRSRHPQLRGPDAD